MPRYHRSDQLHGSGGLSAADGPARTPARYVTIDAEDAGRRIDNFLHSVLPDVPRGRLYRLVRRGEVRVDGARVRAGRRLRAGEAVRIPPVAAGSDEPVRRTAPGRGLRLEERILYEDERLLVLNKPAGLAVHGGSGISFGVIELLRAARPRASCLELVHRLDRDTSGCLIVAKRRSALRALHEALRGRVLDKRYVALLRGSPTSGRQRVDLPLDRGRPAGGERRVQVSRSGRESVTELAPIVSGTEATLAEALPRTGRTHQIRVHCAALGHPIAGDERYGDEAFNLRLRRAGLRRLFLHAARVRIEEPGRPPVVVRAPLDRELIAFASRLGLPRRALVPYGPRCGSESI